MYAWKTLNLFFGVINICFAVLDLISGNISFGTLASAVIGTLNLVIALS